MRRTIIRRDKSPQQPAPATESGEAASFCQLTALQRYLVPALTDPACGLGFANTWVNSEAIRLRPAIGPRRVERAMQQLLRRHDVLRLHFLHKGDGWIGRIRPAEELSLRVEDHAGATEEELQAIVDAQANEPMPIDSDFLCDIRMLCFGDLGVVILGRVHHSITDGYGLINMAEDLVRLILNFPGPAQPMSHLDYLREVDAKLLPFEGEIEAYWRKLLLPPPAPAPLGRAAKGHERLSDATQAGPSAVVELLIEDRPLKRATKLAAKQGGSFFTLMSAAFADVLFDLGGTDDILLLGVMGRSDAAMRDYVGCHLHFPTLRLRKSDGPTLQARAGALSAQLRAAQAHLSVETAHPFGGLSPEIHAAGGHDFQFGVAIAGADGRARNSMLGALLRSRKGRDVSFGPMSVCWMAVNRDVAMPMEMRASLQPYDKGAAINVVYDTEAFDTEQAEEIARRIDAKLFAD